MSGLNKVFHESMWFLEHVENPRSSCGRSGRSWSHGTDSLDNQCWHKASQAAGGAGVTLQLEVQQCMHFSGLSQDCWHAKHSSLFQPSFHVLYFFLQGTVSLTSLSSVTLQAQLQFLCSLETLGNLETDFFQILQRPKELSFWPTYREGQSSPQDTWSLHSLHWTETHFSNISHCGWQDESVACCNSPVVL